MIDNEMILSILSKVKEIEEELNHLLNYDESSGSRQEVILNETTTENTNDVQKLIKSLQEEITNQSEKISLLQQQNMIYFHQILSTTEYYRKILKNLQHPNLIIDGIKPPIEIGDTVVLNTNTTYYWTDARNDQSKVILPTEYKKYIWKVIEQIDDKFVLLCTTDHIIGIAVCSEDIIIIERIEKNHLNNNVESESRLRKYKDGQNVKILQGCRKCYKDRSLLLIDLPINNATSCICRIITYKNGKYRLVTRDSEGKKWRFWLEESMITPYNRFNE